MSTCVLDHQMNPARRLDEPLIAEVVVVADVPGHAHAARVEALTRHSVVAVGHVVLEKSPANLTVDQEAPFARGKIEPGKWNLQTVAKLAGGLSPAGVPSLAFNPR